MRAALTSVYSETAGVSIGEKVNRNLFFDLSNSHIYITTEKKVTPVGKQPFCYNSSSNVYHASRQETFKDANQHSLSALNKIGVHLFSISVKS